MNQKTKILVFCILLGFIVLIGILHTITPAYMILYHDTYRRVSYFPIAIGAIMFGIWGGIILAVASCLSFVPHLLLFFVQGPEAYYSELSEIIFYLAAGIIIGLISSRMNRLSQGYKKMSEQLSASYKRLHDQAARLVEAEKQLGESKKLSMLGQVSASLAHEIKNPLASIKGATEILADEVEKEHPKYEFVEIMRNEISRLNQSVEDVLSFCRGQQSPESIKHVELETVIDRVLRLLEEQFSSKQIEILQKPDPEFSGFLIDESGMTQVLINVMLNAVDAVGQNGTIEISYKTDKDECRICVADDGPGIAEFDREDVFHSFVTHKEGGTGLGLAISLKIVKRFNGRMLIEDSRFGGACICMIFPLETGQIVKGIAHE